MKHFYTDREIADILGVSVSLVRKLAKHGPAKRGKGVLDLRLVNHIKVGDMRRWDAEQVHRLLGISG